MAFEIMVEDILVTGEAPMEWQTFTFLDDVDAGNLFWATTSDIFFINWGAENRRNIRIDTNTADFTWSYVAEPAITVFGGLPAKTLGFYGDVDNLYTLYKYYSTDDITDEEAYVALGSLLASQLDMSEKQKAALGVYLDLIEDAVEEE